MHQSDFDPEEWAAMGSDSAEAKLRECWQVLEEIARNQSLLTTRARAAELLRRQGAPGWTGPGPVVDQKIVG